MLGDRIASALAIVGMTTDRVTKAIGAPCRCKARQARLNAIDAWARRVLAGKVERAREYLDAILGK